MGATQTALHGDHNHHPFAALEVAGETQLKKINRQDITIHAKVSIVWDKGAYDTYANKRTHAPEHLVWRSLQRLAPSLFPSWSMCPTTVTRNKGRGKQKISTAWWYP
jgi:hypothetical protein